MKKFVNRLRKNRTLVSTLLVSFLLSALTLNLTDKFEKMEQEEKEFKCCLSSYNSAVTRWQNLRSHYRSTKPVEEWKLIDDYIEWLIKLEQTRDSRLSFLEINGQVMPIRFNNYPVVKQKNESYRVVIK